MLLVRALAASVSSSSTSWASRPLAPCTVSRRTVFSPGLAGADSPLPLRMARTQS